MSDNPTILSVTKNFSSLLTEGRYTVPWHQRSYDWSKDNVKELLRDIKESMEKRDRCYFLGSVMLIKKQEKTWEINDGQQRIVTFSLICGYLCRIFHNANSAAENRALRLLFDIGDFENKTLIDADQLTPRLTPPQNDKKQYYPMIRKKNIGRNGKLTDAWNTINTFFSDMNTDQAIKFFDFLTTKIEVSCLYIPKDIDHNFVFEVINNRGKKLEDFDLIRNYIYSLFNASDNEAMRNTVHENLEKIKIELKTKAADYVRCFFQCEYGYLPKENFYRKVKEMIITEARKDTATYVHQLLEQLSNSDNINIYKVISGSTIQEQERILQEFIKLSGRQSRNLFVLLREMQRYSVTFPIVFSYMRCFINILKETERAKQKRAVKLIFLQLHNLCSFIMRTAFVAPKFAPSDYAASFANIAKTISTTATSFEKVDIFKELSNGNDSYGILDDKKFKDLLKTASEMKDSYRIRRFLYGIVLSSQEGGDVIQMEKCTIEHILPESSKWLRSWKNFDETTHKQYVNTVGNLTLLSEGENDSGQKFNESFKAKKEVFNRSCIKITKDIYEFDDWTPDFIQKRQSNLANMAVKTWNFKKNNAQKKK